MPLSLLNISYELTTNARGMLGADGLKRWSWAFGVECERAFPGVDVTVTTRWSNTDGSRYGLTGETLHGDEIVGGNSHYDCLSVYGTDDDIAYSTIAAIEEGLHRAEVAAWDRACDVD